MFASQRDSLQLDTVSKERSVSSSMTTTYYTPAAYQIVTSDDPSSLCLLAELSLCECSDGRTITMNKAEYDRLPVKKSGVLTPSEFFEIIYAFMNGGTGLFTLPKSKTPPAVARVLLASGS